MEIISALSRKPGGYLVAVNYRTGEKVEIDTYTCCHCQRVVIRSPRKVRRGQAPEMCRRCMRWRCSSPGCVIDCNPIALDGERAHRDLLGQPWMLRHHGHPVDRIVDGTGKERLVLRKNHGYTLREMGRWQRS